MAPLLRACTLPGLRLIRVSGEERARFLQGQLTQDVGAAGPASSAVYGWASAQGRLLVTGQLLDAEEALWLTVPADLADAVARRLRMYVLRARVAIEVSARVVMGLFAREVAPLALDGATLGPGPLASASGAGWLAARAAGDPSRVLLAAEPGAAAAPRPAHDAEAAASGAWQLADIRAGIPTLAPATSEAFIPQMVNLDLVGGVAVAKGCYAGQEIITRTRHLGRIRRRMLRFAWPGPGLPLPGDAVHGAGGEAGRVVAAAPLPGGGEALAVVRLEALAGGLWADEAHARPLARLPLPYAVPEA
jgi:hypothetical protein